MDTNENTNEKQTHTKSLGALLAAAVSRAVPVVAGIEDKALDAPTPCVDYDVRALANHLLHVVVEFQKLAVKQDSDFSSPPDYVAEAGFGGSGSRVRRRRWSRPGPRPGPRRGRPGR